MTWASRMLALLLAVVAPTLAGVAMASGPAATDDSGSKSSYDGAYDATTYTYHGPASSALTASADTVAEVGSESTASKSQPAAGGLARLSEFDVAAETSTDLVRYDPEYASRELLGQNTPGSSGYATTPAGRQVSGHAAERIALGGDGRPPTTTAVVDQLLDSGTDVTFDPIRQTIRVRSPMLPDGRMSSWTPKPGTWL